MTEISVLLNVGKLTNSDIDNVKTSSTQISTSFRNWTDDISWFYKYSLSKLGIFQRTMHFTFKAAAISSQLTGLGQYFLLFYFFTLRNTKFKPNIESK